MLSADHPGMGALSDPGSGATSGQPCWVRGWTQGWAEVPYATAPGISVCASVYEASASDKSLQTSCRTVYCGRTLTNSLLIKFSFRFKNKIVFNLPQGAP